MSLISLIYFILPINFLALKYHCFIIISSYLNVARVWLFSYQSVFNVFNKEDVTFHVGLSEQENLIFEVDGCGSKGRSSEGDGQEEDHHPGPF